MRRLIPGCTCERDSLAADDRGVSTALGYVITLGITAVLLSGLLIAGGTLVKNERDVVARDQLAIAGEQLASGLADADRLASAGGDGDVRVELWLPDRAGGGSYALRVEPDGGGNQPYSTRLVAESGDLDVSRSVTIRTNVDVAETTVDGGAVVVRYVDTDGDGSRELLVEDADQAPDPNPNLGGALPPATALGALDAVLDAVYGTFETSAAAKHPGVNP